MTDLNTTSVTVVVPALSYLERQIFATLLGAIAVTGLIGNGVVILAVFMSRKLRRCVTNAFVASLSMADLAACLSMPWTMVSFLHPGSVWPLPDALCRMGGFGLIMSVGCSIITLAMIALNRLLLVTLPRLTYKRIYTPISTALMILLSWLVPMSIASVPLFTDLGQLGYSARTTSCTRNSSHPKAGALNIFIAMTLYPVPCLVIIVCYTRLYLFTRKHSNIIIHDHNTPERPRGPRRHHLGAWRVHISKRHIRVTKNMLYVVLVFGTLVTPYGVTLLFSDNTRALPYTAVLLSFNSCVNPFIYATKHPDFKTVIICILSCRWGHIPGGIRMFRSAVHPLNI
ncbi:G-protein coupled receptor moody-like [Asterias rubens]|uniref:G-protein coupled receptor moody-like n=1 Tax=Asterias rubens TaxID=7604 RepID=UPI001454FAB8|nr:G-protein coupled receptor moody-like [Asterias rubens]